MFKSTYESLSFKNRIEESFVNLGLQIPDVFFYEITDSTNTRAKLYAEVQGDSISRPAIFFSHAQYAGRGTRGRSFESPTGGGVYISFLITPKSDPFFSLRLTTLAAVSVCRAVKRISPDTDVRIKWVNDVTVSDKKLSGILTEGKIEDGTVKYAIVGIGVNVSEAEHSPEVKAIMTSLSDIGIKTDADEFATVLSEEFFISLKDVTSDVIFSEYKALSSILNRDITVTTTDGTRTEKAIDIAPDFSLLTQDENGNIHRYISADVTVRPKTSV